MSHLLILEDDVELSLQWARSLETHDYTVLVAHGATDALQVIAEHAVNVCIVDLLVRPDDVNASDGGLVFLGRIEPAERQRLKIIGVSGSYAGSAGPQGFHGVDAEKLLKTFGADMFLPKPFFDTELVTAVQTILAE